MAMYKREEFHDYQDIADNQNKVEELNRHNFTSPEVIK